MSHAWSFVGSEMSSSKTPRLHASGLRNRAHQATLHTHNRLDHQYRPVQNKTAEKSAIIDTGRFRAVEAAWTSFLKFVVDSETRSVTSKSATSSCNQTRLTSHTCTSFSPNATCFTSATRAALSGFGSRSYASSRIDWSSGLLCVSRMVGSIQSHTNLVLLRFCRASGLSSTSGGRLLGRVIDEWLRNA